MRRITKLAVLMVCLAAVTGTQVALANHDHCHALTGGIVPGPAPGPSCQADVRAQGILHATSSQGGSTVTVAGADGPIQDWLELKIERADGTLIQAATTAADVVIDSAVLIGRASGTFEIDGVIYQVDVALEGQGEATLEPEGSSLRASRLATGILSLHSSDDAYHLDAGATGDLVRFWSFRASAGVIGCLGPICG